MSPLFDVLFRLSVKINMQEDLSNDVCPHKSSRLSESPLGEGDFIITLNWKFNSKSSGVMWL